ncbi:CapA family protein [Solitalea lacus]|uniref:CapA family protein n=1 Tax=Solitalea lacus TaxID=2911172 RepID=UPI001EDB430A|nr:CapA family protein [Solitalea lacus]UKJ08702.1 CapA family protein [Solitalea lacus]
MNKEDRLFIGFTGDVMIGRLVNSQIKNSNHSYVWGNVLPLLQSTDLNIINLETALTRSHDLALKTFNFKADPEHISVLTKARIDAVNLANNHVLDYGVAGLWDTIKMLQMAGVKYAGAGENSAAAARPAIFTKCNIRIGLLGFTDNEPGWQATADTPGINYVSVGDTEKIKKDIESVREMVDLLIVSIHWGPNMRERPNTRFVDFAHFMIDGGVDIIYGHSAHIFQGIEWYNGKLIMYDTGDFVDDYKVTPAFRNDLSFFFVCEVDKKEIKGLKLFPVLISNCQVNLATGADYKWAISHMQILCSQFDTEVMENGEVLH